MRLPPPKKGEAKASTRRAAARDARKGRSHLTLTLEEAVAQIQGNYPASVAAYDKVHAQILHMADMLSAGIIRQFPQKFRT